MRKAFFVLLMVILTITVVTAHPAQAQEEVVTTCSTNHDQWNPRVNVVGFWIVGKWDSAPEDASISFGAKGGGTTYHNQELSGSNGETLAGEFFAPRQEQAYQIRVWIKVFSNNQLICEDTGRLIDIPALDQEPVSDPPEEEPVEGVFCDARSEPWLPDDTHVEFWADGAWQRAPETATAELTVAGVTFTGTGGEGYLRTNEDLRVEREEADYYLFATITVYDQGVVICSDPEQILIPALGTTEDPGSGPDDGDSPSQTVQIQLPATPITFCEFTIPFNHIPLHTQLALVGPKPGMWAKIKLKEGEFTVIEVHFDQTNSFPGDPVTVVDATTRKVLLESEIVDGNNDPQGRCLNPWSGDLSPEMFFD